MFQSLLCWNYCAYSQPDRHTNKRNFVSILIVLELLRLLEDRPIKENDHCSFNPYCVGIIALTFLTTPTRAIITGCFNPYCVGIIALTWLDGFGRKIDGEVSILIVLELLRLHHPGEIKLISPVSFNPYCVGIIALTVFQGKRYSVFGNVSILIVLELLRLRGES